MERDEEVDGFCDEVEDTTDASAVSRDGIK